MKSHQRRAALLRHLGDLLSLLARIDICPQGEHEQHKDTSRNDDGLPLHLLVFLFAAIKRAMSNENAASDIIGIGSPAICWKTRSAHETP